MKCTECSSETVKVIYAGFPMRLCNNKECNAIYGFWWWITGLVPVEAFCFYKYTGNYFVALFKWLTTNPEGD